MNDGLLSNYFDEVLDTDIIFDTLNRISHTNFSCKRKYRDRKFHEYHQYNTFELALGAGISRNLKRILKYGGQKI